MVVWEISVGGQLSLWGSICHVPVVVSPTVNCVLCYLEDTDTKLVKMKHKKVTKVWWFVKMLGILKFLKNCIICYKTVRCFKRETYTLMMNGQQNWLKILEMKHVTWTMKSLRNKT